jgi:oligopeptide/dipeptide ABC transporter ATP-binding protein
MRQRVMIAIAIACRPRLLIADEPTTALDVTIQAQVLDLLAAMRAESGMGMVLISHDLGVVAAQCDRVAVMYGGQVVESGPTRAVIDAPRHPYTRGLLRSRPDLAHPERPIVPIGGQIPDPAAPPPGCRFRPRCPEAGAGCDAPVALRDLGAGRAARCVRVPA